MEGLKGFRLKCGRWGRSVDFNGEFYCKQFNEYDIWNKYRKRCGYVSTLGQRRNKITMCMWQQNYKYILFRWIQKEWMVMKSKMQELLQKKVYTLVGEDVVNVLEGLGKKELFEKEEDLEELLDYVNRKVEIPWQDYVEPVVEMFESRRGIK